MSLTKSVSDRMANVHTLPELPTSCPDYINTEEKVGYTMGYDTDIDTPAPVEKEIIKNTGHNSCKPEIVFTAEQQGR